VADLDREVGGLRCRDVLAFLADYVDGELDQSVKEKVEAHLGGCDWCEKFGGEYSSVVSSLRRALREDVRSPSVSKRLKERMRKAWDDGVE